MAETGLTKMSNVFVPMVEQSMRNSQIAMTDYQKLCVTSAMQQIYQLVKENNLELQNIQANISDVLMTVAALQLNANAQPSEVYFIARNITIGKDDRGRAIKTKGIEMGIEGDGNDALLARFGRNVAYVHPFWLVREGDMFEEPKHRGIEIEPPIWEPEGDSTKRVMKVVYPIDMYKGIDYGTGKERPTTTEYFITDREQVKKNLIAHMKNNLMWEKDKEERLKKIREFAANNSLDEILDSEDMVAAGKISPAWYEPQSRETMIIRKMRNNIVKKIPKDFANGMVQMRYEEVASESHRKMVEEVSEEANSADFDHALENGQADEAQQATEHVSQDLPIADSEPDIIDKPEPETPHDAAPTSDDSKTGTGETEADPF